MKIRLADFVADFLVDHGIKDGFSVVGGGAMHLNDAFGHKMGLHMLYNHHEQGSAIAAEAYARLENKPALLCVTTGPGGTNALTGVVGAWLDSIPMFVVSGQVRFDTTARYNNQFTGGDTLRAVGDQEYEITKSAEAMTKYAVMVTEPLDILYHLERAFYLMTHGRPGPVWLDIPVNFQGTEIETEGLRHYDPKEDAHRSDMPETISDIDIETCLQKIKNAKRPVLFAGNGIRLSGGYEKFLSVIRKLNIPVVTYWDSIDLVETEDPLYVGRSGNMGDRPGNFAIQNADLLLAIGNRIPIRATGFTWKTWAREAYVIMVDADRAELNKPTLHVDLKIHGDAKEFLEKIDAKLDDENIDGKTEADVIGKANADNAGANNEPEKWFKGEDWITTCQNWKKDYPVVLDRMKEEDDGFANAYAAFDIISRMLPEYTVTVTSNGTPCVAGHQSWYIKKGSRFFNNNAIASMGYGLPATVGACVANAGKKVICLEGDGSLMMNIQELQTVVTNHLPVKMILINNEGYHSIRQTQNNLFSHHSKVGIGPESGDVSFPDYKKVFEAFGWRYHGTRRNAEIGPLFAEMMQSDEPEVLEIFVSKDQIFEPKSSTKKLPDGSLQSPPLEDLAPFLPREEMEKIMFIPMIEQ